jgi:hypothetical protein
MYRAARRTCLFTVGVAVLSTAQSTDPAPPPPQNEEKVYEGYTVHQSVEFGGRIVSVSGSQSLWDTFVNLNSGPRLLSNTLEMHSPDHTGLLFDDFAESSFGYGGDPNNATRLRISKSKWYNFNASFRRDRNYWDYDLLVNPMNPSGSNPTVPVLTSPHQFQTVRRMSDFSLTLMPLSKFRARLGYSRNVSEGPSTSTYHGGTETLLQQNWRNGLDSYQLGFDYKVMPRTNISYDQFFHKFKGDTNWIDNSFNFQLANGTPVDLGLPFNTAAGQPCATPIVAGTTNTATPTCNGETAYNRSNPIRTFYPVEQLSFQSSYFKRVDFSGRMIYSSGSSDVDFSQEFFQGLQRANLVQFLATGPATAKRVSVTSDFAVTVRISEKLKFSNSFRWNDFRLPGLDTQSTNNLFSTTMLIPPNVFNPATCPAPFTAAACPKHTTSSAADMVNAQYIRFLGENSKLDTTEIEYDFTPRIGADIGYRYQNRDIVQRDLDTVTSVFFPSLAKRGACAAGPVDANGICTNTTLTPTTGLEMDETTINEHSLLLGLWLRPIDTLRINLDTELMYADNVFTRISPRHLQHYRLRTKYQPRKWINLGMAVNDMEKRNNIPDIGHLEHNRSYSFNAVLSPSDRWGFDASYNYNDVYSQTNICYVSTPAPTGVIKCSAAPFLEGISLYTSLSNFGAVNFMFKPVPRVTTMIGYTITSNTGDTLILNPNTPLGTLNFNYHLPTVSVAVDLAKGWTGKAGWNYYGYGEGLSNTGPTAPRDFHAHAVTLALRYAF